MGNAVRRRSGVVRSCQRDDGSQTREMEQMHGKEWA